MQHKKATIRNAFANARSGVERHGVLQRLDLALLAERALELESAQLKRAVAAMPSRRRNERFETTSSRHNGVPVANGNDVQDGGERLVDEQEEIAARHATEAAGLNVRQQQPTHAGQQVLVEQRAASQSERAARGRQRRGERGGTCCCYDWRRCRGRAGRRVATATRETALDTSALCFVTEASRSSHLGLIVAFPVARRSSKRQHEERVTKDGDQWHRQQRRLRRRLRVKTTNRHTPRVAYDQQLYNEQRRVLQATNDISQLLRLKKTFFF